MSDDIQEIDEAVAVPGGADPLQPPDDYSQPDSFALKIQGGILENLGIKMYSKVGKVLVEFAANAYDSDSPSVDIDFDMSAIEAARKQVTAAALERLKTTQADKPQPGSRKPPRKAYVVVDPLPDHLTIRIRDDGHGMTAIEMAERFLPLNRNRRRTTADGEEDNFFSEAGKRLVMGRKGIGKLSGFGVAERMVVRSKRKGQPFWTELDLRSTMLKGAEDVSDVSIPHGYVDASHDELEAHGTTITLSGLRCDSANFTVDEIADVLNETYYPIQNAEFAIRINGAPVPRTAADIAFVYPVGMPATDMRTDVISDPGWGELSFRYRVQFRAKRLAASKRGAYVYSKGRLAMSPSMLGLTTGVHNFMAHQYMECLVESDDLDNLNIDVIGTNRSDIIQNSDVVRKLFQRLEFLMTDAIKENAIFKEQKAEEVIDGAPEAAELRRILDCVSPSQRANARALAKVFLGKYGVETDEFKHLTPLIVGAANAGGILIDLVKVSNTAETIAQIAPKLIELREIERSDSIKLFQGRRNGILGLQRVVEDGYAKYNKGPHDEKALHRLLKAQPWLIRPDLSGYVSSDEGMRTVLSRLSEVLEIDGYAKPSVVNPKLRDDDDDDENEKKKTKRPDLVAIVGNGLHPERVFVIELKAASTPLRVEHITQLKTYMTLVREFLRTEYAGQKHSIVVEGALIGAMPKADSKNHAHIQLLAEIEGDQRATGNWEVIGLNAMLSRTLRVHQDMLAALRVDELDGLGDGNTGVDPAAIAGALASAEDDEPNNGERKPARPATTSEAGFVEGVHA